MIERINDWRDLFAGRSYNWQEFTVVTIHVERDNVAQSIDLTLVLLGIGVGVVWYAPRFLFPGNQTRDHACAIAERSGEISGGWKTPHCRLCEAERRQIVAAIQYHAKHPRVPRSWLPSPSGDGGTETGSAPTRLY